MLLKRIRQQRSGSVFNVDSNNDGPTATAFGFIAFASIALCACFPVSRWSECKPISRSFDGEKADFRGPKSVRILYRMDTKFRFKFGVWG